MLSGEQLRLFQEEDRQLELQFPAEQQLRFAELTRAGFDHMEDWSWSGDVRARKMWQEQLVGFVRNAPQTTQLE
jgi:hypothetical protein